MKRFYYNSETRTFSDQQTAEDHAGELDKALEHILKLELRFNYVNDRNKHISDISNWLLRCKINQSRDRSSKGIVKVMLRYASKCNKVRLCNEWTERFRSKYGWSGRLTLDDFETALSIAIECINSNSNSKSEIMSRLELHYPIEI